MSRVGKKEIQIPKGVTVSPTASAVKVKGKPLYKYARAGEKMRAAPRPITLHAMDLLAYDQETLRLRIHCSRGTYARVLADEIAVALGSAGHLEALCRDRSGPFFLDDAVDIDTLAEMVAAESGHPWKAVLMGRKGDERVPWRPRDDVVADLEPRVRSDLQSLSHLPLADVAAPDATRIRSGGSPPPPPAGLVVGGRYVVVCGNELVAIAENDPRGPKLLRVA